MSTKLEIELANAKTTVEITQLLIICDRLHNGYKVIGYTVADLPNDVIYETYVKKVKYNKTEVSENEIMNMSTIPKEEINKISSRFKPEDKIILMPKFDGISVALKFKIINYEGVLEKAHTRGKVVGSKISNTDVFDKMNLMIQSMKFKKPTKDTSIEKILKMKSISIRAEIVGTITQRDESGNYDLSQGAPLAAGIINGGMKNFEENMQNLCLQAYEVSKIEYNDDTIEVPQQNSTLSLLSLILINNAPIRNWSPYHIFAKDLFKDENTYEALMKKYFFKGFAKNLKNPLDGIVYCASTWKYPTSKEEFNKVTYGKNAWKPNPRGKLIVKSLTYSMGKTGELSPIIQFEVDSVDHKFAGKVYKQTKFSYSKLLSYLEAGLGVNTPYIFELSHGITLQILYIIDDEKNHKPLEVVTKCPFCKCDLKNVDNKHLLCINKICPERIANLFGEMIKIANKYKTLTYLNDKGKEIRTKISVETIKKLPKVNLTNILTRVPNLMDVFNSRSLEEQLNMIGCGTVDKCKKLISKYKWNTLEDVPEEYKYILNL